MPAANSLPMLMMGSFGEAVRLLQKALNKAPSTLPKLAEDAAFGPKTGTRVKEFQGKSNLTPDGVVGPLTWGQLQPWLKIVEGLVTTTVPSADEASARGRIVQQAEAYLKLYGWEGTLPKQKNGAVDRAALRANPLKIAAAYCSDGTNPFRPRAGGASLGVIFHGAGGTTAANAQKSLTITAETEGHYQLPGSPAKTTLINKDIGSWCGVFATFVMRMAGLQLSGWPPRLKGKADESQGPAEFERVDVTGDVRRGDMGVFDYTGSNHHFLVTDVQGDRVLTIDGNIGDPDPAVVAPWSSVIARRSYTRVGKTALNNAKGKTSPHCYFMRPIFATVLKK